MGEEDGSSGTPIYDISTHHWGYTEDTKRDATFLASFLIMMVLALTLSSVVAHKLKWHLFPEACVVLTVGLVFGFVCKLAYGVTHKTFFVKPLIHFDNTLFFLGLLPPIIFNSGYDLHPRWLFGLFVQIMAFAIVGTFVSTLVVGVSLSVVASLGLAPQVSLAETLTFGALISATDPVSVLAVFTELKVDPKMFYLVFGESVLNDAVGIVLFKTFSKYVGYKHSALSLIVAACDFVVIFAGSMLLGFAVAVATALCLKLLRLEPDDDDDRPGDEAHDAERVEERRKLQIAVLACAIFAPAFLAELVELSGIVATLFAAIGVRHWGMPNLQESHAGDDAMNARAESLLSTVAHLADTAVFLYLGLSVPAASDDWRDRYSHSLVAWSILACLAGRAVHVYPLSLVLNRHVVHRAARAQSGRPRAVARVEAAVRAGTIPANMQHMLWFAGLRGAVAFSCAHTFPNSKGNRALFSVTTSTIIIVSMYLLGALTVPVLTKLAIPTKCEVERRHPESPGDKRLAASSSERRNAALRALRREHPAPGPCSRADDAEPAAETSPPLGEHLIDDDRLDQPNEAPRPSGPLRLLALLDAAYLYPAVVRAAPRPRRPPRDPPPPTPQRYDDDDSEQCPLNVPPRDLDDHDDEAYRPPDNDLEMVQVPRPSREPGAPSQDAASQEAAFV